MKLPLELARARLFRRGVILRKEMRLDAATKPKYLVVVGVSGDVDPIFSVITTSQMDWHQRHPGHGVRIPAKTVDAFVKDTIVDCRKLYPLTRDDILASYVADQLEYCGELPAEVLELVTLGLAASTVLTPFEKALVVPPNGDQ